MSHDQSRSENSGNSTEYRYSRVHGDALDQVYWVFGINTEHESPSHAEAMRRDEAYIQLHNWILNRARR